MFPKDKDTLHFCRLHREVPGVARAAGGAPQDSEGEKTSMARHCMFVGDIWCNFDAIFHCRRRRTRASWPPSPPTPSPSRTGSSHSSTPTTSPGTQQMCSVYISYSYDTSSNYQVKLLYFVLLCRTLNVYFASLSPCREL